MAFILVSIIATATTVYYYQEYVSADQKYNEYYGKYLSAQQNYTSIRGSIIQVNVTIDYGNGTSVTNEAIYLAPNTTFLDALRSIANVNATYWEAYQSLFINAINNVFNNANNNNRWWVYFVNAENALVSPDNYKLHDGDQIEWTYYPYYVRNQIQDEREVKGRGKSGQKSRSF